MKNPKPRGKSRVKKRRNRNQQQGRNPEASLSRTELARLLRQLDKLRKALPQPTEYDVLVPSEHYDHPDWWAIFQDYEDEPNPFDEAATQIMDGCPEIAQQVQDTRDLKQAFHQALPGNLKPGWLDLEVRLNNRRATESSVYFNVGVEMGRKISFTERALRRSGFAADELPPESLFSLAYALAEIADRLPRGPRFSVGDEECPKK